MGFHIIISTSHLSWISQPTVSAFLYKRYIETHINTQTHTKKIFFCTHTNTVSSSVPRYYYYSPKTLVLCCCSSHIKTCPASGDDVQEVV